jgi:hypothetical protein
MKAMRYPMACCLLVLVGCSRGAAPALEGVWVSESEDNKGQRVVIRKSDKAPDDGEEFLVFAEREASKPGFWFAIKTDPKKGPHAVVVSSPWWGHGGASVSGTYKLEGDRLTIPTWRAGSSVDLVLKLQTRDRDPEVEKLMEKFSKTNRGG